MKNIGITIKWGVIFTIVMMLWNYLEMSLGLHDEYIDKHPVYTNFFAILAILIYVIALRDVRKNTYGGDMTWSQGFVAGMLISVVVALLSPVVMYVTFEKISPSYFRNIIDYTVENKIHSREAAENFFNLRSYMMQGIFSAISMGVVTSAVVALFVKTRKTLD